MARTYAQKRYEKVWVCDDATAGALTQPVAGDQVKGTAYVFTGVAPSFVESQERRETPDVAAYIQRKTQPQTWSIECYAKAPATAGDLPSFMNLLKHAHGRERQVLTVADYAQSVGASLGLTIDGALTTLGANGEFFLRVIDYTGLVGKTVTVTITGTPHVLTEGGGGDFTASVSNDSTATSLASAIGGLSGVGAAAVGAVITVSKDVVPTTATIVSNADVTDLTIAGPYVRFNSITSNTETATNLAAAITALTGVSATASTTTVLVERDAGVGRLSVTTSLAAWIAKTKVRYTSDPTDAETPTLSIWVSSDNLLSGFRNCKVESVEWTGSGTGEPMVKFSGLVSHEVSAGVTTLGAGYTSGGASLTLTAPRRFLGIGDAASDKIKVKVDSEVFLVTALDYGTGVATVTGAQDGTSAANHDNGATVEPYVPGADPDAGDTLIPITLGSFTKGSSSPKIISFRVTQTNGYGARLDEAFEPVATGFRRENNRSVAGEVVGYQTPTLQDFTADVANGTIEAMTIVLGSTGTQTITLSLPRVQLVEPPKSGDTSGEFTKTFPFVGLASETPGNDNLSVEFA